MNEVIVRVAQTLMKHYQDRSEMANDLSIFLCGGNGDEEVKLRRDIGTKIAGLASKFSYAVFYPEDMFIELILGHQRRDLLSLENLLADSVNAVAILLHSAGTFTELGAFANHEKLRDKLIVVVDPKYAHSRSFINLGPIRFLVKETRSRVIYEPMVDKNVLELVKSIADATREIANHSKPAMSLSNPISSYEFFLALVYVLDPVPTNGILEIASILEPHNGDVSLSSQTVVNGLINERKLLLRSERLSTTESGAEYLIHSNKTKKRSKQLLEFLTGLRLQALNQTLRKNVWVEQ